MKKFILAAIAVTTIAAAGADNAPIGVFDSGLGGLTVLERLLDVDQINNATGLYGPDGVPDLAHERFTYLGDQANMPYGDYAAEGKSDFLRELILKDAKFLLSTNYYRCDREATPSGTKQRVKIIVIACNTATAWGLDDVRKYLAAIGDDTKVVGVIEAGVRATLDHVTAKAGFEPFALGVMATPGTIASGAYERTIRAELKARGVACEVPVINQGCAGLADAVESGSPTADSIARSNLISLVERYRASGKTAPIRAVILGCTHYPFVLTALEKTVAELRAKGAPFAEDFRFVDPAFYTAAECHRILRETGRLTGSKGPTRVDAFLSVANPALPPECLTSDGQLTRTFKYGRNVGSDAVTTKPVSLTRERFGDDLFTNIGRLLPRTANLLAGVVSIGGAAYGKGGNIPLPEHPRPDWERPEWVNLNGQWDFGFEKGTYDKKITVPFGWGSGLSGVKDEKGKDTGYYRRKVSVPREWKGKRVFLVVGAADYDTEFSFDGKPLGKHVGGYTPFEFELTDLVKWGEEQTAEFKIWDPDFFTAYNGHYLFGKQGYGNVRGIWQTVYLEARGREYIDSVRFTPWIEKESDPSLASQVLVDVMLSAPMKSAGVFRMVVDGREETVNVNAGARKFRFHVGFDKPHLWTLDDPYLYDVTLTLGDDTVKSYFGFREVGVGKNANGDAYVTLNGKPIYLQMCLDQSYHPEGYYTFPTDEYMKNEIMISKKLALSGNRVHIKVEVPRKLYWADKLGLLIQADVPNAWGPASDAMFAEHWKCFEDMVKRDFNHPSIYQWTLFNETWGLLSARYGKRGGKYTPETQRRVADAYRKAKALDPTRLIDDNSVCLRDHVATDVNTWHRYCPAYAWYDKLERVCTNTYVGSVCNYAKGYAQNGAPMMNAECGNVWGYKGSTGDCDFTWDYHTMINAFRSHLKCGGWLYTEHHDVIIEWNGYVRDNRTWKETGLEDVAGMTLADFHGKAAVFMQGRRGYETGEVVQPGETVVIPVGVSFITDEFAGKKLTLSRSAWWFDGAGRKCVSDAVPLGGSFVAKSWQCEKLWDVEFVAPGVPACGCVIFDLFADGKRIARNFWSFSTVAKDAAMLKPKASKWSEGTAEVMGGLKLNGFGKGWFEYEIAVPPQGGTFRAELSAKRKNWKDRDGAGRALDYPTGKRTMERSKNPNSYPQTCDEKFPANLTVRVGGKVALKRVLPDDPADHRGLLSWLAQPHDGRLREAGSYGYLVEVVIPPEAVKDGKAIVRLESDAGLAIYGPRFGRYPLGPYVTGVRNGGVAVVCAEH